MQEPLYMFRVVYDLLFFFIVIIITLNLIFGVIIDTFGDLRQEKQEKDYTLRNTCFICGNCLKRELYSTKYICVYKIMNFKDLIDLNLTIKQFLSMSIPKLSTTCGIICIF